MAAMALMLTRVSQSRSTLESKVGTAHLLSGGCQDMQSTLVLYNSRIKLACTEYVRSKTEYNNPSMTMGRNQ